MYGTGIVLGGEENSTTLTTLTILDDIQKEGIPTIKGISVENVARGIYNENSAGKIDIKGADISANSTSGNAQGIINYPSNTIIIAGTGSYPTTITGISSDKNGYGISVFAGNLKLWNTESTNTGINKNYPTITGSRYGVYAETGTIFEFYDGKIIGKTAIYGNVTNLPDGTEISTTTEDSIETAIVKLY